MQVYLGVDAVRPSWSASLEVFELFSVCRQAARNFPEILPDQFPYSGRLLAAAGPILPTVVSHRRTVGQ